MVVHGLNSRLRCGRQASKHDIVGAFGVHEHATIRTTQDHLKYGQKRIGETVTVIRFLVLLNSIMCNSRYASFSPWTTMLMCSLVRLSNTNPASLVQLVGQTRPIFMKTWTGSKRREWSCRDVKSCQELPRSIGQSFLIRGLGLVHHFALNRLGLHRVAQR